MFGASAFRTIVRDLRSAALCSPFHVDDLRFLLSQRRPNDYGCYLDAGPSSGLESSSSSSLSPATLASTPSHCMAIDRHRVYVESVADVHRIAKLRRQHNKDAGRVTVLAGEDNDNDADVTAGRGNSGSGSGGDANALTEFFWLKKRLSPLAAPSSAASVLHTADDADDGAAPSKPRKGLKKRAGRGMPVSAAAMGPYNDIMHTQRVDGFPFASEFFALSPTSRVAAAAAVETPKPSASVAASSSESEGACGDSSSDGEGEVRSPAAPFCAHAYITESLPTHSVQSVEEEAFTLLVDTAMVEPFFKPPVSDPMAQGTDDEVDVIGTTLPTFELNLNFVMNGRHTHSGRLAIVNTHFYVLESNGAGRASSLVEHVGLMDAKSIIGIPNSARAREVVTRLAASQQHTMTVRLVTADSGDCVGAIKGRVFYRFAGVGEDILAAPIRCVEFSPVALKEQ